MESYLGLYSSKTFPGCLPTSLLTIIALIVLTLLEKRESDLEGDRPAFLGMVSLSKIVRSVAGIFFLISIVAL